VKYDTAFLSGHVVEQYKVILGEAAETSRRQMIERLRELCARQVPGDTHRNLQIHPTFSALTFKHLLVPIWLLTYNYGRRAYQVLVNGYTGKIAGRYPYSPWKVLFLILAIVVGIVLVLMFQEGG
jgi:hypothetical protein